MPGVWLFRPPGVYRPQGDTWLLADTLRKATVPGIRVLDVGTGTGVLALTAARNGAGQVVAVDVCPRAVFAARVNARMRRLRVRVVRGDVSQVANGESFDVIVSNPPYVCADEPAGRGSARTWNGGSSGRAVLDGVCTAAPSLLAPGGIVLIVQSALCGTSGTLNRLRAAGLHASVIARRREPFGPVMRARAAQLEGRGLIWPSQRYEELVVIRAEQR
jgi:release factor glutamine methyltransferase